MGIARLAACTLLAAWLAGCTGVSVSQDYDPSETFTDLHTFDWFPGGRELTGDVRVDSPFIDQRVRLALIRTLVLKGYEKVADRTPDFYVNYHVSLERRLESSGINTYYGTGTYGSWGGVGIGIGSTPIREYDQGTLVIDFVDGHTRKLVWRGTGSRRVASNPAPEETTRAIDESVDEILKQFPPKR
jgi:hypothetical protein